jgi:tRNA A37 methylthiotransferase MiaB
LTSCEKDISVDGKWNAYEISFSEIEANFKNLSKKVDSLESIPDIFKIKKEVMFLKSELVKMGKDLNVISHYHGSLADVSTQSVKSEVLDEMRSKVHWYNIF